MRMTLVAPPALQPVTLDEAKAQCRVDGDEEKTLIESYIGAAVSHLDGYRGILGRCLITQDWQLDLRALPTVLRLPFPDATVVGAVYTDVTGGEIAWLPHESLGPAIWRASAGWGRPVSITLRAGFGPLPGDVPAALRVAILLMVQHLYERQPGEMPASADSLISPFRMRRV